MTWKYIILIGIFFGPTHYTILGWRLLWWDMPIPEQLYIVILFTHERRAAVSAWNGGLALQESKLVFLELLL